MWTPGTIDLKITIGGVDITAYVPRVDGGERGLPGIHIEQVVGKAIDTCSFAVENGAALDIDEWDEIVVSNTAVTVKYFAGFISQVAAREVGPEVDLTCQCQDYTILLEKAIINQEWKVITADTAILTAVRANSTPALTELDFSSLVTAVGSTARLRASRRKVRDLLDDLAARVGADWYMDYDKKLHWFQTEDTAAPYDISDAPNFTTTFPAAGLERMVDGSGVVNRVTVVGGAYLSDNITHEYAGDAQQVRFVVPHFYQAQSGESSVLVDVNTGSDAAPVWAAKSVGIKYIDDAAGKDVLFAFQEKYFEFAAAPPLLVKAWRVRARYQAPLRQRVSLASSYALYGRWLEDVLVDASINSKSEAQDAGMAYLAERNAISVLSGSVEEPGLRAGQVIHMTDAGLGLNGDYLIRRLGITCPGPTSIRFAVELGDYLPDLYEMLREIAKDAAGMAEWRDDEVLDELLQTDERLTGVDAAVKTASTRPYVWGTFRWGFSIWGPLPFTHFFNALKRRGPLVMLSPFVRVFQALKFYAPHYNKRLEQRRPYILLNPHVQVWMGRKWVEYLLRDEFTTTEAAPMATPRTCEPGPGTLTLVDPDARMSISGGKLVCGTYVAGPCRATSPIARAPGAALYVSAPSGMNNNSRYGFGASAGGTRILDWAPDYAVSDGGVDLRWPFTLAYALTNRTFYFVLRSTGAFYINGAELRYISATGNQSTVYGGLHSQSNGGDQIEFIRIATLGAPWDSDYGIATSYSASALAGDTATMEANGTVEATWTAVTNETFELDVRRTDNDNRWIVRCSQSGSTIKLIQREAGSETERSSAAVTLTNGVAYRIVAYCSANTIQTCVGLVPKNSYASATFNNTATGAKVSHAVSDFVAWPRTLSGAALTALEAM